LTTAVSNLNKNVEELSAAKAERESTIKTQDTELNNVWYILATDKELKAANIISGGGLFRSLQVMKGEFDKSGFTKVDLRNLTTLPLNTKKAKVLSSHPADSYELAVDADKMVTLQIIDAKRFWSVSRYLVISVTK
jgi:hypothetical protein